jgi:hypothetical protein
MKKALENIFLTLAAVFTIIYFVFCFQVWASGYDSLYQYFNMM